MDGIGKRLQPGCILIDPQERNRDLIIGKMVERLAIVGTIANPALVVQEIMKREALCSTDIGFGCAIPHAHTAFLDTTVIAAARISPPLAAQGPDKTPLSLIFLMVGPENQAGLHLKLLSKLARLLHDAGFRDKLNAAENAKEFHQLVCQKEE